METWLHKKIGAVSFRRVLAWGAALVGGLLLLTSNQRYLVNFFNGPFTLRAAELDAIDDVETTPRYFAQVTGSRVIDTGLREYSVSSNAGVETSRKASGAYYALVVGERFLIFKTGSDASPSNNVEGRLVPWPSGLESQLFDSKEMQELRPRFYPFYVQNGSFRIAGIWLLVGAIAFVALLAWKGRPAWRHWRDPSEHPLLTRSAGWGDPLSVAVLAEREFENPRFKAGGWRLGDTYLVQSTTFAFNVLRTHDLLWAYKKITKHSVNFIPTGKSYEAILTCYGGSAVVRAKEKVVDAILTFAHQRAPWAVIGYSDELVGLFNKQQAEFVAAVEQRRAEGQRK